MSKKRIFALVLSTLMICALFTGCGASAPMEDGYISNSKGEAWSDNFNGMDFVGDMEMAPEAPMESPSYGNTTGTTSKPNKTDEENTQSYLETQKLVYTCNISMETLHFEESTKAIKDLVKHYGGFIEADTITDNSYDWYYDNYYKDNATLTEYVTIRIPSKNYEAFLNGVSEQGKVTKRSENVDNITKNYNDTATLIATLTKEKEMLLEMMDKCTTIDEMITVETRLSAVSKELAVYQRNMDSMEMDIAFSTVNLTIKEVMQYTPEPYEEPTYLERLGESLVDSIDVFLEFMADLSIALIYFAPFGILMLVIIFIAVKIIKACIKRNANKPQKEKKIINPYAPPSMQAPVAPAPVEEPKAEEEKKD